MVKESYEAGYHQALEKLAKAIPGGAMTLLERLESKAAPVVKRAITKPVRTKPAVVSDNTLDYSKFNKSGRDHRPAANPNPEVNWNLIR